MSPGADIGAHGTAQAGVIAVFDRRGDNSHQDHVRNDTDADGEIAHHVPAFPSRGSHAMTHSQTGHTHIENWLMGVSLMVPLFVLPLFALLVFVGAVL